MAGTRRDLEQTRSALEEWFTRRLERPAVVSELTIPKAGFSNETVLGTVTGGDDATLGFVARIQPTGHQLFLEPDALFQARMMRALARTGAVVVPEVLFEEPNPAVLGAPFFVMRRVEGRVPSDTPSWHAGGWTTELGPDARARLYDNGLRAMVALHAVDPSDGFGFLERTPGVAVLDAYIAHVRDWYEWADSSLRFNRPVIDAAMAYVEARRPADQETRVSWGDARVGNLIFDDHQQVVAMLDWEGAALGPPGIDVAWWLMFEDFFSVEQGTPRLHGVPGPAATLARYEELSGRSIPDIDYYRILAGLVFSLINSRLADLYITSYGADPAKASAFVDRICGMTARWLDES